MVGNSEIEALKIDISTTLRDYLVHLSLYATRSLQGLPHLNTWDQSSQPFRFGARGRLNHSVRRYYAWDGPCFSISMFDNTSYTSSICRTRKFLAQSSILSIHRGRTWSFTIQNYTKSVKS